MDSQVWAKVQVLSSSAKRVSSVRVFMAGGWGSGLQSSLKLSGFLPRKLTALVQVLFGPCILREIPKQNMQLRFGIAQMLEVSISPSRCAGVRSPDYGEKGPGYFLDFA